MTEIYNTENISKYTYRINEEESEMFIFELVLKKFNQTKNLKLRRVKNSRTGKLIGIEDNIKYDDIKKSLSDAIENKDRQIEEFDEDILINEGLSKLSEQKLNECKDMFDDNMFYQKLYWIDGALRSEEKDE